MSRAFVAAALLAVCLDFVRSRNDLRTAKRAIPENLSVHHDCLPVRWSQQNGNRTITVSRRSPFERAINIRLVVVVATSLREIENIPARVLRRALRRVLLIYVLVYLINTCVWIYAPGHFVHVTLRDRRPVLSSVPTRAHARRIAHGCRAYAKNSTITKTFSGRADEGRRRTKCRKHVWRTRRRRERLHDKTHGTPVAPTAYGPEERKRNPATSQRVLAR